MKYRKLGRSGLTVSEICLGTMTFGGEGFWRVIGAQDQSVADALVKNAVDKGVNFIDTANVYSNGLSEQILGQSIKNLGLPRDELVIATKVFGRPMLAPPGQSVQGTPEQLRRFANPNTWGLSRKHILDAIDASLERLGLDYVDLYQTHAFDPITPIEETLETFDEIVRSGRARYIGICNNAAWQLAKALGISAAKGLARFESAQMYYSIAGRDLEREITPLAKEEGFRSCPGGPLAGGFLSGKFTRDGGPNDARRTAFDFPPVDKEKAFDIIDVMRPMRKRAAHPSRKSRSPGCCASRKSPASSSARRTEAQLENNIAASEVSLTADELSALNKGVGAEAGISRLDDRAPGRRSAQGALVRTPRRRVSDRAAARSFVTAA
ncbi:MAG: aldo/keto reductase [Terricaulis sp.]